MSRSRSFSADLAAWATLAVATLVILWPLGTTNRILAGVDAFTYFDPYWDYRMAALRAGELPLWNPYLFLGVPFLANPQAAVLYPLHWPLSWLSTQAALIWSALLHVWLAAGFTYTLARRSFRLTRPAAWLAGALFVLGGFALARVENINQLNALAWFPALLWLYDETAGAASWRGRVRWGSRSRPSSRCNCWPATRRRRSSTWSGWGCMRWRDSRGCGVAGVRCILRLTLRRPLL